MKIKNPVLGAKLLKYPYGNIFQFYGENVELYQKAIGTNGHNGVDIVSAEGTPIIATKGEVCEVKNTPDGYGKHVRILTCPDENGDYLELTFGHLRDIMVKIGDKVEDGQILGTMGNTGFVISGSTIYWGNAPAGKGVHLHFGSRECSTKNTGWVTQYSSGKTANVKNYDNGVKGATNPLLYLQDDIEKDAIPVLELAKRIIEQIKTYLNSRGIQ
jgi:murein DD-endopeptidase MepM/ murein hydrolase activator NlpD